MLPVPPPMLKSRQMTEEEFYAHGEYGPRLFLLSLLSRLSRCGASDQRKNDSEEEPLQKLRPSLHG